MVNLIADVENRRESFKGKLFDVLFSEQKPGNIVPAVSVENAESWRKVRENAAKVKRDHSNNTNCVLDLDKRSKIFMY